MAKMEHLGVLEIKSKNVCWRIFGGMGEFGMDSEICDLSEPWFDHTRE